MLSPSEFALAYTRAGISIIPILPYEVTTADGNQDTPFDCSEYVQRRIAAPEELCKWFTGTATFGLAAVHGPVSGGLECLALVHAGAAKLFRQLVTLQAGAGLLERLPVAHGGGDGWTHIYYRCPNPVHGCSRLAQFEVPSERGVVGLQVLAYVGGEGTWTALPSLPTGCGGSHTVCEWLGRDLTAVPTLTEDERQLLLESASCLNAWVDPNAFVAPVGPDGFDDNVTWDRILLPLCWKKIRDFGDVAVWHTPGRTKPGYCAVSGIGFKRNLLYDIRSGRAYTKFGAFGSFHFDGDFEKARCVRLPSAAASRWETPTGRRYLKAARQAQPLVSCIMPTTGDRQRLLPQAIKCFQHQSYPNSELVIVCDGEDDLFDLVPPDDRRVRYFYLGRDRHTVGSKRNFACERAQGELIAHFDDDDWSHPERLGFQVGALLAEEAEFCGLSLILVYIMDSGEVWLNQTPALLHPSLWHGLPAGNTFLYRKSYWTSSPFPDASLGEDGIFIRGQGRQDKAVMTSDYRLYVAMVHGSNTSDYRRDSSYWSPWRGDIREVMGTDLDFYLSLRQG